MNKIGLGLIGLGYIGKVHLRNCLKLDSAALLAVSDISKKALNLAKKMGINRVYNDYKMLLKNDKIDAVIIALPNHLHLPCAKEAAEAGKHILLEKPLAKSVAEGKEIISTAKKNNIKLMVGYAFRFSPSFKALKDKIENGEIGEVQIAYATDVASGPIFHRTERDVPRPVPEWWFKKELTGGGALIDLGSHMINLTRWYFGEVNKIEAYLGYKFDFNFEDHAICIANFTSGTKAIINVGWFSQETVLEIELFGTVAHAYAHHSAPSKIITAIQLILRQIPKYYLPHFAEVSHFVKCIEEDTLPSPSGEDALKDLEAIERAYKNHTRID